MSWKQRVFKNLSANLRHFMRSLNTRIFLIFALTLLSVPLVAAQIDSEIRNSYGGVIRASEPEILKSSLNINAKGLALDKDPIETPPSAAIINSLPATKTYRVGRGDVLTIDVQNFSRDYTVRNDGSIDFPLIADSLAVSGQTVETLKSDFEKRVKLFINPQISITVRDRASHSVIVTGLVDVPGGYQIVRDAVPLYTIRATALVSSKATEVKVTRSQGNSVEMYMLAQPSSDNILIFPGDEIEFLGRLPE